MLFQADERKVRGNYGDGETRHRPGLPDRGVAGTVHIARDLGLTLLLAEGIETEAELLVLREAGIRLFQGHWFPKPTCEELPPVRFSAVPDAAATV